MKVAILAESAQTKTAAARQSRREAEAMGKALESADHQVTILDVADHLIETLRAQRPDICCIAPGTRGAQGALQGMLELVRIPYVGSGSEASRLANEDQLTTYVMRRYAEASEEDLVGEPLASYYLAPQLLQTDFAEVVSLCEERIPGGYPFEVCAHVQGGQRTVVKVNDKDSFVQVLAQCAGAQQSDAPGTLSEAPTEAPSDTPSEIASFGGVTVRQWVEGVRMAVAVLGTGWDAHVLPPAEMRANDAASTPSESKWQAPVRLEVLSADESIAQAIRSEVERTAFEVCLALGVRDLALVHVVWDGAQVRLENVDTAPSLFEGSALDASCKAAGLSLAGVLDRLVSL